MKRDMDLVRNILRHIEQSDEFGAGGYGMLKAGDYCDNQQVVNYHMQILADGGLVEVVTWLANATPLVRGLTWKGHDLFDTIRDPEIWKKLRMVQRPLVVLRSICLVIWPKDLSRPI